MELATFFDAPVPPNSSKQPTNSSQVVPNSPNRAPERPPPLFVQSPLNPPGNPFLPNSPPTSYVVFRNKSKSNPNAVINLQL